MFYAQSVVAESAPDSLDLSQKHLRPLRIVIDNANWSSQRPQLAYRVLSEIVFAQRRASIPRFRIHKHRKCTIRISLLGIIDDSDVATARGFPPQFIRQIPSRALKIAVSHCLHPNQCLTMVLPAGYKTFNLSSVMASFANLMPTRANPLFGNALT